MRYAVSGANTAAIEPVTGALRNLLGKDITTNRVFWLRAVWYGSSGTQGDLYLYDATAGATSGTKVAAYPALMVALDNPGLNAGYREIAPPGLKFKSGCCAWLAVSGAIAVGECGGAGYEE